MKKVYLVIKFFSCGKGCDDKPYKVYENRDMAFAIADEIFGYVEELDYVKNDD